MNSLNDNKKEKITEFVKFVRKQLQLEKCPTIVLQNGRGELKTTASYDYSKNRAIVDIMRSIAHEMVHHKQFEEGRLVVKPADIGGDIEDEANSKAGQYIKLFAQIDKTIYDE